MDDDSERDENITEARVSGVSSRALAKQYGCTTSDVEAAVDRRFDFELDGKLKLRSVKLDLARIERLFETFFELATGEKEDVAAGTLCCKLLERKALFLGTEAPLQSRVDVYQVEAQQQPSRRHDRIREAIMRLTEQPPVRRAAIERIDQLGPEKALEMLGPPQSNGGDGVVDVPAVRDATNGGSDPQ